MSRQRRAIGEWRNPVSCLNMPADAAELIARRRRQMLVHSFLYYELDEQLVDDHAWQEWADELWRLQEHYGHRIGFYDAAFLDWDGSTGYHLPRDADVRRVAARLLTNSQRRKTA